MKEYLKRNEDGSVNVENTVNAFRAAVVEFKANSEIPQEKLVEALKKVFASRSEKRLPMALLTSYASDYLDTTSTNLTATMESLRLSIRGNKDVFKVVQGKNGGVELVSNTNSSDSV